MSARQARALAEARARMAATPTPARKIELRLVRSGHAMRRVSPHKIAENLRDLGDPRVNQQRLIGNLRLAGYEVHIPGVDDGKRYKPPTSNLPPAREIQALRGGKAWVE